MGLPEDDDLDAMTALIAGPGATFASLGPESRIQIVQLVSQACLSDDMFEIAQQMVKLNKTLDDMAVDTDTIRQWFKHSKLFEGL